MQSIFKMFLSAVILILSSSTFANTQMSSIQAKQFVKTAVIYALENRNPDYSKYVSKDFVNYVDKNTFNYQQWVQHQKNIKKIVKSMHPTFIRMVAEGNNVAAVYMIHLVKNDGSTLDVKDMGVFVIKNNKVVLVDELTHLMQGNEADKDIGSTK